MFGIKVGKKEKEGETGNGSPSWQTTARLVGRGGGWQGGTVQSPADQSPVLESECWQVGKSRCWDVDRLECRGLRSPILPTSQSSNPQCLGFPASGNHPN